MKTNEIHIVKFENLKISSLMHLICLYLLQAVMLTIACILYHTIWSIIGAVIITGNALMILSRYGNFMKRVENCFIKEHIEYDNNTTSFLINRCNPAITWIEEVEEDEESD